jgi:murein DD-endopeptidase MepM/ murein hydrolase activator NlpD
MRNSFVSLLLCLIFTCSTFDAYGFEVRHPSKTRPARYTYHNTNRIKDGYYMRPVDGVVTNGPHGRYHSAVDFRAAVGTPVRAAAEGQVILSGWDDRSGNKIIIYHPNGTRTVYCHLSRFFVLKGGFVRKGEIIALSGETGWDCRGAHLHFDVWGAPNPFTNEVRYARW